MCKTAFTPDSITPVLAGGMGQNSSKILWEAFGRIPVTFHASPTV